MNILLFCIKFIKYVKHSIQQFIKEIKCQLLAEIGKSDELKDKNTEISDLRREFAKYETKKTELKARIAKLLRQAV